ncbi:hypothetical protein OROMI_009230 [Orobanche minor]
MEPYADTGDEDEKNLSPTMISNEDEDEDEVDDMCDVVKNYTPTVTNPQDIPFVGKKFELSDDALIFYKQYALQAGFNVRKHSNKLSENGTSYRWFQFTCSREGVTNLKYQRTVKHQQPRSGQRKRGRIRCGCMARLTISRLRDRTGWVISNFTIEHNHPLTSPGKVHFLKINRRATPAQKNLVCQFSQANIPTCQQFRFMGVAAGSTSSVVCLEQDIINVERDMRKEFLGHEAETLLKLFERENKADENFYYGFTTDKKGVFEQCFWSDSALRSAFIVFDTTYNTNRYGLKLAPFVGVNNHGQTVLFGCGFLNNETTESFTWLFSQFLQAMPEGSIPKVIITDQDQAIRGAICKKLGPKLYADHQDALNKVVYDSETPDEFERKWENLMTTTSLGGNDWLGNMYGIRDRWVPTYVKDFFVAGMSSSQRVEGHHSFLKTYVLRKNSLVDFFVRFQIALAHQREQETKADHIDKSEVPITLTPFPMEEQMRNIYTKEIFLLFQDELKQSVLYDPSKISSTVDTKVYEVKRCNIASDALRLVTCSLASNFMICSCKLFQFSGYPCRHILCLMQRKRIRELSDDYILPRWTQKARLIPVFDETPQSLGRQSSISASIMMSRQFMEIVNDVSMSPTVVEFIMREVRELGKRAREMLVEESHPTKIVDSSVDHVDGFGIQDPLSARAKGSGKLRSSKEKGMSQSKKRCGNCHKSGHNIKTCMRKQATLLDEDYYQPEICFNVENGGNVPFDDVFLSQGGDNYCVYQTMLKGDEFLEGG